MKVEITEKLCSKYAEAAVLGSMLQDPGVVGDVVNVVRKQDFFTESHKIIFRAIVDVWTDAPRFDGLLVRNWLDR
ncbi:MAG: hypothetical protein GY809_32880, partial [Planctomycetes bacterium]|nr:hypothetical protein [Planctomycetota bacterium]